MPKKKANKNQGASVSESKATEVPQSWSVDGSKMKEVREIQPAHRRTLEDFIRQVNQGVHPSQAAVGGLHMKELSATSGIYEIRLSQGHRATFTIDEATCTVVMKQVGGHT